MWKFDVGLEVSFKPLFLSALKHVFVAKTYKMFWRMDHTRKFMSVIIQSNKTKLMDINSGNKFSLIISNIQEWKTFLLVAKLFHVEHILTWGPWKCCQFWWQWFDMNIERKGTLIIAIVIEFSVQHHSSIVISNCNCKYKILY